MQNKRLKSIAGVYLTAGDAARGLKPNQHSDTESVPEISHHYSQIWNEFRENQFSRLTSPDGTLKAISGQSNYNLP